MVSEHDVLAKHRAKKGKIEITGKVEVETKGELSTYYTPGVAYVSLAIKANRDSVYDYTLKGRTVAIVTDGTRILGLGKIGPEAGLPVMEGKALLLKKFGGVDAFPICINTTDEDDIIELVKNIQPSFGAINIEDIETPKCFRIVDRLKRELEIPVFHDDRYGVAVVTLAALFNALKLAKKRLERVKIVINGSGSAGTGIAELLHYAGAKRIYMVDTHGAIYKGRRDGMNYMKEMLASMTNKEMLRGDLADMVKGADVLIGASAKGAFKSSMIKSMAEKPIVFALANPYPEIDYDEARGAGAFIVATGRSDTPNQVNNLYAFPGVIRGMLEARATRIDEYVLLRAAIAISKSIGRRLSVESIMPDLTDRDTTIKLVVNVAVEVAKAVEKQGYARVALNTRAVRRSVKESIKRYRKIERLTTRH